MVPLRLVHMPLSSNALFVTVIPVTITYCNCQGEEGREEVRLKKNVNRSLQRLKEQIKAERAAKRLLRDNAKSSNAKCSNGSSAAAKVSNGKSHQCVMYTASARKYCVLCSGHGAMSNAFAYVMCLS
jgi:hypothetical protein